jgi:SAM-dependent methyltransferase
MPDIANWDQRYQTGETPWDTGQPSAELRRVVAEEKIAPCPALEPGCGTGTNAIWLAQQGFDVTAVDVSPEAIERARQRAADAGVRVNFLVADLMRPLPVDGPFRFFFDRGCYHVMRRTDVRPYLESIERVTGAGAVGLVLAGNARERLEPGPPVVTEEELRAEWGHGFEMVWLREFRFDAAPAMPVRPLAWSCFLRRHKPDAPARG